MTHDHNGDGHDGHDHVHLHEHDHEHSHSAPSESRLAPSGQATVVLDIGDGVGALVVHTSSALSGVEIELARTGETKQLVHTEVRERILPEGSVYAGVFVSVDEGDYTLLDFAGQGPRDITIRSGEVTEVDAR